MKTVRVAKKKVILPQLAGRMGRAPEHIAKKIKN
jgi:hypothetical protein